MGRFSPSSVWQHGCDLGSSARWRRNMGLNVHRSHEAYLGWGELPSPPLTHSQVGSVMSSALLSAQLSAVCFLIYKNIYNLFSICDQTFVSTQYKAKLHRQCQRFCIFSVARSCVHYSQNPNTTLKIRLWVFTQFLWRVCISEHWKRKVVMVPLER